MFCIRYWFMKAVHKWVIITVMCMILRPSYGGSTMTLIFLRKHNHKFLNKPKESTPPVLTILYTLKVMYWLLKKHRSLQRTTQYPLITHTWKIYTHNSSPQNSKNKLFNKIIKCIMKLNNGKWVHLLAESLTLILRSFKYVMRHSEKINLKRKRILHHY